jgi:TonB family protein
MSGMTLRASSCPGSPCVVGIVRPVLLWPAGISDGLTDAQLDAVMRHELSHVRRRDNLGSMIHTAVEILFWFNPLVWWLGARLVAERERACDQRVLAAGAAPAEYADAILRICECSIARTAVGVGIAGSTLKRRVEAIMSSHASKSPGWFVKTALALMAAAMLVGPVALGAFGAQQTSPGLTGGISGVVTDEMGGVVSDVDVAVTARTTGTSRTVATDEFGRYVLASLAPGSYELRFSRPGFRPQVLEVTVGAGSAQVTADAKLRVGSVTESVTLIADAPRGASAQPVAAPQAEVQLHQKIAERADDVEAHLALAELYYKEERFAESAIAMDRAAALWVAGRRAQAPAGQPTAPSGDIKAPTLIHRVNPIYPDAARTAGVTGTVVLEAIIGEDGTVQDARVLRSVPALDDSALGAVRQWLYEPTRLNGVPVAVAMQTTIRFATN